MDLVLEACDSLFFDKLYAAIAPISNGNMLSEAASAVVDGAATITRSGNGTSSSGYLPLGTRLLAPLAALDKLGTSDSVLGRENPVRQALSLLIVTTIFGWILYITVAALSYFFVYDPENFKHPKYLKNQVAMEIHQATTAIPVMTALTVPWFVAETQGYSKLYWSTEENGGLWYLVLQFPLFLFFTDALIYMIHRGLHHPLLYKRLHKPHHKWIVPTPFASHAFHPVDGYFQSIPYHLFPFVFPLQKTAYIMLFTIVNIWTVMIHDGEYLANDPIVNGSACHTVHHLYFNYNYGQYTTLWDRLGGSYRLPDQELFDKSLRNNKKTLTKELSEMERIMTEVEGEDDRVYVTATDKSSARKR